ncbi:MAG: PilZ domain-containing protein [Pyrinomonadaceae bacterium]
MAIKDSEDALSPAERRYSDRKKLVVDVSFNGGDATGIANTRDIGIGGLYITTKTTLEVGTPIFMRMTIGGEELTLNGTVVYSDPGKGVGVRFQDLSKETESVLKSELDLE